MSSRGKVIGTVFLLLMAGACSHRSSKPFSSLTPTPVARISGQVLFVGKVPAARKVALTPAFARFIPSGLTVQPYQVGTNGGLGEVLVFVTDPPAPPPLPALTEATLSISNTLCHPAVLAVYTNQPIRFRVEPGPLMNLSASSKSGQNWNRSISETPVEFVRSFDRPDLHIRLTDNNAVWLVGRIAVFDHPWFAVTDATGHFTLPPLPPGRYTLEAVRRRCGHQTVIMEVTNSPPSVTVRMTAPSGESGG